MKKDLPKTSDSSQLPPVSSPPPAKVTKAKPKSGKKSLPGWVLPTLVFLVAASAVVLLMMTLKPKDEKPEPVTTPPVNVRTMVITAGQQDDTFEIKGTIKPRRVVHVAAETGGRIDYIYSPTGSPTKDVNKEIKKGAKVDKGQELFLINTDSLQATRTQAQTQVNLAERDLKALEHINEQANTVTDKELADAKSRVDVNKAVLLGIQTSIDRALIVSPIDGTLNRMLKEHGEWVNPGEVVAEIVDTTEYQAVFSIPEREATYFRKGNKKHIISACSRGKLNLKGEITYFSVTADGSARTTQMEMTLEEKTGKVLHSGLIVTARLSRRKLDGVIMIPLQSIIPTEKGHVVFVAKNGIAFKREIEIDMRFIKGSDVRVLSGLSAGDGDRLIVEGHRFCGNGQVVREEHVTLAAKPAMAFDLSGMVHEEQLREVTADLTVRLQRLTKEVQSVDIMQPGDLEIAVVLDPAKIKSKLDMTPEELIKLIDSNRISYKDGELTYHILAKAGRATREIVNEMVLVTRDNKPTYVRELAKVSPLDDYNGMHLPVRKIKVICSWPGKSNKEIEDKICSMVPEDDLAEMYLGNRTMDDPKPGIGKIVVSVEADADQDVIKILAQIRDNLSKLWIDLPDGAREPIAILDRETPIRRVIIRKKESVSAEELTKAVEKVIDQFRKDHKGLLTNDESGIVLREVVIVVLGESK